MTFKYGILKHIELQESVYYHRSHTTNLFKRTAQPIAQCFPINSFPGEKDSKIEDDLIQT